MRSYLPTPVALALVGVVTALLALVVVSSSDSPQPIQVLS